MSAATLTSFEFVSRVIDVREREIIERRVRNAHSKEFDFENYHSYSEVCRAYAKFIAERINKFRYKKIVG